MGFVRISKHCTITAYRLLTRVAVVGEWGLVLCAHLFSAISRSFPSLLDSLNCFGNIRQESGINQLIWPQHRPTMRTLLASFFDPLAQTIAAGEFGAGRAHDSILDGAEADEAGEDLFKVYSWAI